MASNVHGVHPWERIKMGDLLCLQSASSVGSVVPGPCYVCSVVRGTDR